MHILYRRYTRSGRGSAWFYALIGSAFVSLAVIAGVRGEWLVMTVAIIMALVTALGGQFMRRVGARGAAQEGRDHV